MYSISLEELLNKSIIRNDMPYEFLNKMTNQEIFQWEHEVNTLLETEGIVNYSDEYQLRFYAETIKRHNDYLLLKT